MMISSTDKQIIRDLAKRVKEISYLPIQHEKVKLWKACNNLEPKRAMIFADPQNGWSEIDNAWIQVKCSNELLRKFELRLRRKIIRHLYIPDDFPICATFDIEIHSHNTGYESYGVDLSVTRTGKENDIAFHIEPAIKSDTDLKKLHCRPIQLDTSTTEDEFETAQQLFGDILEVRQIGRTWWRYGLTRVLIHMLGLEQFMFLMYDDPERIHSLMAFLRDDFLNEIEIFQQSNAMAPNYGADNVNGSGGLGTLNDISIQSKMVSAQDCICWGEAQETVGVGLSQFEEFVLQYQLPLFQKFGLVDYGCCEPLDRRVNLLIEKVPNLRWLSVSPWADREVMAEAISNKYVYVYKPNPAIICAPEPDWKMAERDVRETLRIAKDCAVHIVMKDTSTFCNEPDRITKWTNMAKKIILENV